MTKIVKFNQATAESSSLEKAAIASLPPSISSTLEEKTNGDWDVIGYSISSEAPIEDLELARSQIMDQQQAPTKMQIQRGIAKLDALTARQSKADLDLAFMVAAYSEKLSEYPADAVEEALDNLTANHWFPTWEEMKTQLDYLTRRRRLILVELDRRIAKLKPKSSVQGLIEGALK